PDTKGEIDMATVAPPPAPVRMRVMDRQEEQKRVRHPLQKLRWRIRLYIGIEASLLVLFFVAVWFWISFAFDFGTFALLRFDYVLRLTEDFSESTAVTVRVVLLCVILAVLGFVAARAFLRLFRRFRDASLALVLERRFPKQLGDRLITAVELADTKLAEKYGYSQATIDHTLQDAANPVRQVPFGKVFVLLRLDSLRHSAV